MKNNEPLLVDKYTYSKNLVTDKNKLESLLIKHIQQICHDKGFRLIEIKIETVKTKL